MTSGTSGITEPAGNAWARIRFQNKASRELLCRKEVLHAETFPSTDDEGGNLCGGF